MPGIGALQPRAGREVGWRCQGYFLYFQMVEKLVIHDINLSEKQISVSINKVLLELCHMHLFSYHRCLLSCWRAESSSCNRDPIALKTIRPFTEKWANPCSRPTEPSLLPGALGKHYYWCKKLPFSFLYMFEWLSVAHRW